MSTMDAISIDLDLAERHTLRHLLDNYVRSRAWEAIEHANNAAEVAEGAERGRRWAQLYGLTEDDGFLRVADLDAQRADLTAWAAETESTVAEHDKLIREGDGAPAWLSEPVTEVDRKESDDDARSMSVVDYAHRCVCEKIIRQIDAARDEVPA